MRFTEIEDIKRQWNEWLNLDSIFEDLIPISLCLRAQTKFNENHKFEPKFMRMSVPLVIRAFKESQAYKRNYFVNYDESKKPQVFMFKTKWIPPEPVNGHYNIDLEKDYLEQITPAIVKEIDSLFSDVANEEITFHGIGCLKDGTLTLSFNK